MFIVEDPKFQFLRFEKKKKKPYSWKKYKKYLWQIQVLLNSF